MKEIYEHIVYLDRNYNGSVTNEQTLNKLMEEVGELASSINSLSELKNNNTSKSDEELNILSELSDIIQICVSLCSRYNFTYEELMSQIEVKNIKWKRKYLRAK